MIPVCPISDHLKTPGAKTNQHYVKQIYNCLYSQ